MTSEEDIAARLTVKFAGSLQEIQDRWTKRLDTYFTRLESLVEGDWFAVEDIPAIIRESKAAAREALDGLGGDLCAQIVRESSGLIARYETERASLLRQLSQVRDETARVLSMDQNGLGQQNLELVSIIRSLPEFQVLSVIERQQQITYDMLSKETGLKRGALSKIVRSLAERGYVQIDTRDRRQVIHFKYAPWGSHATE